MKRKNSTNVLFGAVSIPRGYCKQCDNQAFVIDGLIKCCDSTFTINSTSVIRESEASSKRSRPSMELQRQILTGQNDRCFYCGRMFGATVYRKHKETRLKLNWDHLTPYSYQNDNTTRNFVAACNICNSLKSNLMFQTLEEAQNYITTSRERKGYTD